MHCQKRDSFRVVALFAPPLEAWIRWVAPFYVLTITFWKTDCVHLASDSAVNQATSSLSLSVSIDPITKRTLYPPRPSKLETAFHKAISRAGLLTPEIWLR